MNLRWHLRELLGKCDLNVEGCRGDCELQRYTVLLIHRCLTIEERVGILLAQLVDLNVGHGRV